MPINVFKLSSGGGGLLLVGGVPLSATLTAITDQFGNVSPLKIATASVQMVAPTFLTLPNWTNTLGNKDGFFASQSINVPSAGNGVFRMIRNDYTINNTAAQTGSVTGIFQNAIETNLNGITHNLMDLQRNSVSQFLVTRNGFGIFSGGITQIPELIMNASGIIAYSGRIRIKSPSTNVVMFQDNTELTAANIVLGLQTNLFPMIKRNGAGLDFRFADDSGSCNISALNVSGTNITFSSIVQNSNNGTNLNFPSNGIITLYNNGSTDFNRLQFGGTTNSFPAIKRALNNIEIKNADDSYGAGLSVGGLLVPSAILQADSTQKGFLMPRMTETQINTIASPADGLMIYNTTIQAPCFYNGLTMQWQKISHSIM